MILQTMLFSQSTKSYDTAGSEHCTIHIIFSSDLLMLKKNIYSGPLKS